MFAYVVLPAAIAHVQRPIWTWNRNLIRDVMAYSVCTFLAIATYAGVTLSVRTAPTKSPEFSPETLLSFPAYQYTNLFPFQIWTRGDLVSLVVTHQPVILAVATVVLLVLGLLLAQRAHGGQAGVTDYPTRGRDHRVLQSMVALWCAAGFIYVLAGGYSFESRKKYVTLTFMVVVIAYVATLIVQETRTPAWRQRALWLGAGLLSLTVATTWMVSSLWILESRRGAALVNTINQHPAIETVEVRFIPNLYAEWPMWRAMASSQHNAEWVTELEVGRRYQRTIRVLHRPEPGATVVECRFIEGANAQCDVVNP